MIIDSRANGQRACTKCGARRSRRFSVRGESRSGISSTVTLQRVKRAKARAPFLISTDFERCAPVRLDAQLTGKSG